METSPLSNLIASLPDVLPQGAAPPLESPDKNFESVLSEFGAKSDPTSLMAGGGYKEVDYQQMRLDLIGKIKEAISSGDSEGTLKGLQAALTEIDNTARIAASRGFDEAIAKLSSPDTDNSFGKIKMGRFSTEPSVASSKPNTPDIKIPLATAKVAPPTNVAPQTTAKAAPPTAKAPELIAAPPQVPAELAHPERPADLDVTLPNTSPKSIEAPHLKSDPSELHSSIVIPDNVASEKSAPAWGEADPSAEAAWLPSGADVKSGETPAVTSPAPDLHSSAPTVAPPAQAINNPFGVPDNIWESLTHNEKLQSSLKTLPEKAVSLYKEASPQEKLSFVKRINDKTRAFLFTIDNREAFVSGKVMGRDTFDYLVGLLNDQLTQGKINDYDKMRQETALNILKTLTSDQREGYASLMEAETKDIAMNS